MHKRHGGFTVIEVIIGIALFGAVMPIVILAVLNLGDLNDRAADITRANVSAERKIEELRSAGYNSLIVNPTPIDFSDELSTSLGSAKSGQYVISSPTAGVKEVNMTISYNEKEILRTYNYKTVISELGVAQ